MIKMNVHNFKLEELSVHVKTRKILHNAYVLIKEPCRLLKKNNYTYISKDKGIKLSSPFSAIISSVRFGFTGKRNVHIIGFSNLKINSELIYCILDDFKLDETFLEFNLDEKYITIDSIKTIPSAINSPQIITKYIMYLVNMLDTLKNIPMIDFFIDEKLKMFCIDAKNRIIVKKLINIYYIYSSDKNRKNNLDKFLSMFENVDIDDAENRYNFYNRGISCAVIGWVDTKTRNSIQDVIRCLMDLL